MDPRFLRAEELGIRLEMVGGLPIWEPHPGWKHQKAVDRIRATIRATGSGTKGSSRCSCEGRAGRMYGYEPVEEPQRGGC